jgi:hypothetical protein
VRHPQAPMEAPWFWVIVAKGRKRSLSDRGYAVSRGSSQRCLKRIGPPY